MVEPDLSVDLYDAARENDYRRIEHIVGDLDGGLGREQAEALVRIREYCSAADKDDLAAEIDETIAEDYIDSGNDIAVAAGILAGVTAAASYYNSVELEENILKDTTGYLVEQSIPCLLAVSAVLGTYKAVSWIDETRKRRKINEYEEQMESTDDLEKLLEPSS